MPKKKSAGNKQTGIKLGNISDISGNVNVAGGNITTHHTITALSAEDIKQLFDDLYARIETGPETSTADREDLKSEVKEIQSVVTEAAQKNKR